MSKFLSVKRLPETLRVEFDEKFYCLITPMSGNESYRDFWMCHEDFGVSLYMCGCEILNDEEAISFAETHADSYIEELTERMENEYIVDPVLNEDAKNIIASRYHDYAKCLPEFRQPEKAEAIKQLMDTFGIPELSD